jgi:hypothetical protein
MLSLCVWYLTPSAGAYCWWLWLLKRTVADAMQLQHSVMGHVAVTATWLLFLFACQPRYAVGTCAPSLIVHVDLVSAAV